MPTYFKKTQICLGFFPEKLLKVQAACDVKMLITFNNPNNTGDKPVSSAVNYTFSGCILTPNNREATLGSIPLSPIT